MADHDSSRWEQRWEIFYGPRGLTAFLPEWLVDALAFEPEEVQEDFLQSYYSGGEAKA